MFSKSAIYAPLSVYYISKKSADGSSPNAVTVSPAETQELYTFLHDLSSELVSRKSLITTSSYFKLGNGRRMFLGGQQSVTKRVYEQKLSQRALTLVGGTTTTTTTGHNTLLSNKAPYSALVSHRKRKRSCPTRLRHRVDNVTDHELMVLSQLHRQWKEYFQCVRQVMSEKLGKTDSNDITSLLSENPVELVGAHIRIVECNAQPCLKGREGLIVMEMENTWQVVVGIQDDTHGSSSSLCSETRRRCNMLFLQKFTRGTLMRVPKKGSKISLLY